MDETTQAEILENWRRIDLPALDLEPPRAPLLTRILAAVTEESGISREAIMSRRRNQAIVDARYVALLLASELMPRATLTTLARLFDRDHTSILYALRIAPARMERRPQMRRIYDAALGEL